MNELQLKTFELVPAKIDFNKESIVKELNETLSKYENLVFTEDKTTEIREVLAKLRKDRTAADEFRKEKKKEAIAPVTEFENEVKSIVKMFDDVIDPINNQLKEFEAKRRKEKQEEVEKIISEAVEEFGLEEKFANQLDVDDQYLTKTFSIKQVKETIEFRANNLLNEQKLEQMNKESIESYVKLKNSEHGLNLSIVAYLSQLEFKDVESVKTTVNDDVQAELDRISREEAEKQAQEELTKEVVEELPFDEFDKQQMKSVSDSAIDDLPFGNIGESEEGHAFLEVYHVTGTMDEQNKLIKFMEDNGIDYKIIEMELPF